MSKAGQIIFNRISEAKNGQYKINKMTTDNEVNFRLRSTPIRVSSATKKITLSSKTEYNSFNNKLIGERNLETISSTPILSKKQNPIRCGEIFVANIAARHWTFTCTFCNKSTRDIGEFICHIKMKHLVEDHEQANAADSDDDVVVNDDYGSSKEDSNSQNQHINNYFSNNADAKRRLTFKNNKAIEIIPIVSSKQQGKTYPQQTSSTHNSTEFYDYNSYLDVNVHTESNEIAPSNKSQLSQITSMRRPVSHALASSAENKERTTNAQIETQQQQKATISSQPKDDNIIVSLIDDDDDEEEEAPIKQRVVESNITRTNKISVSGNVKITAKNNFGDDKKIQSTRTSIKINNIVSNGNTVQNIENDASTSDLKNQTEVQTIDNNNLSINTDEENDDFDNQLLIAPDDSNKEDKLAKEKNTSKRRQIRGSVYCAICKRTFQYYSLYRNHMIKHSNETPFTCPVCRKGFKSKPSIRYHLNTHHKERRIKCELCDATYHTQFQLVSHIVLHENSTTFPCMVCGKIMSTEKEREMHLATHTEERPFCCDFCRKRFHKRHHLSNHLKRHRHYRCDYCKEEFRSDTHLRKPYACKSCATLEMLETKLDAENRYQLNSQDNETSLASSEINPLQLPDGGSQQTQETIDCEGSDEMDTWTIDCEDDEEETEINEANSSETAKNDEEDIDNSNSLLMMPEENNISDSPKLMKGRFSCKYCPNKYSYKSGLNYHLRMKHS